MLSSRDESTLPHICIYVHNSIKSQQLLGGGLPSDCMVVTIDNKLLLYVVHVPQNEMLSEKWIQKIREDLSSYAELKRIIIYNSEQTHSFLTHSKISSPTSHIHVECSGILSPTSIDVVSGLGAHEHPAAVFSLKHSATRHDLYNGPSYRFFDIPNGDYNSLKMHLNSVFHKKFSSQSVNSMTSVISRTMSDTLRTVPRVQKGLGVAPFWTTRHMAELLITKQQTQGNVRKYSEKFRVQCSNAEADYMDDLGNRNSDQHSEIFSEYILSKKQKEEQQKIHYICDTSDKVIIEDKFIAEAFSVYFDEIYVKENPTYTHQPVNRRIDLQNLRISKDDVMYELGRLHNKVGSDDIHEGALKKFRSSYATPLTALFNKSLQQGKIPQDWKTARIAPGFKKGDKDNIRNYRPISITSVLCKILERLIVKHIEEAFLWGENPIISPYQHSGRNNCSVTTNLLQAMDQWTESLNNKVPVDIIFLDLNKAYDTVPHEKLLALLGQYGINQQLLRWIREFITGRKQYVRINGQHSANRSIVSGIPQGSVISSALFQIFVNHLPRLVKCKIVMFNDDIKIFSALRCNNRKYTSTLQADLNALNRWATEMQMTFNTTKTKVMHLGNNNPKMKYLTMSSTEFIAVVEQEKDLGVIVDRRLTFTDHIEHCVQNTKGKLKTTKVRCPSFPMNFFMGIYCNHIREPLEDKSCIWSPIKKEDEDILEYCQQDAISVVEGLANKSYTSRLKELALPTLKYRRLRADLIQLYKYHKGIDRFHKPLPYKFLTSRINLWILEGWFMNSLSISYNRGCESRSQFFLERVAPYWNRLSERVVKSSTLSEFKRELDEEMKEKMYTYKYKSENNTAKRYSYLVGDKTAQSSPVHTVIQMSNEGKHETTEKSNIRTYVAIFIVFVVIIFVIFLFVNFN